MSPREKHVPDSAQRTSVCFTAEDRAAIHWIREVRRGTKSKRTTINDIIVDALWHYLERAHGKTRDQIQSMLPPTPPSGSAKANNVTQMPKPRKKH
jgi:hypothetical protein